MRLPPTLDRVRRIIADDPRGGMTRELYEKPDYRVYSLAPEDDHKQVDLRHDHRYAQVDKLVAPLVLEVWKRGWETMGSCQERPPESQKHGWAYLDFPAPGHGRAFKQAMIDAGIPTDDDMTELTIGGKGRAGLVRHFVVAKMIVYVPTKDIERAAAYLRG